MGKSRVRRRRNNRQLQGKGKYLALAAVAAVCVGLAGAALSMQDRGMHPGPAKPPMPAVEPTAEAPLPSAPEPMSVSRGDDGILTTLFVGDSLTGGFFASSESAAFPALVAASIGDVESVKAERAHQTLSTVSGITAVPAGVELAVVQLGTNDVGIPTPISAFTAQYDALLAKIRAASPDAAIVCAGTWSDAGGTYDAVISERCEAAGGRFVSLSTEVASDAFHGPAGVATWKGTSDTFHPNDAGHRAIADALLAAIAVE